MSQINKATKIILYISIAMALIGEITSGRLFKEPRQQNILDTSFQMAHSGVETSKELVDKLFYDYIGYKFDTEEKETKISILIDKTEAIIIKEYKKYLRVEKSKINGFSLDFFNEQTKNIHHSLIGSIENIARAFINVPVDILVNQSYDFLNIKVKKLQLGVYNYSNEDDIAEYCEILLSQIF